MVKRNRHTHTHELVLRLSRSQTLDPACMRWLKDLDAPVLLSLCLESNSERSARVLRYDVEGYVSLARYVRGNALESSAIVSMVRDLRDAVTLCTGAGFSHQLLLCDVRHVFVGRGPRLRFACLPVDAHASLSLGSPLEVLGLLGDARRLRLVSANDYVLCERVCEHIALQRGVFSPNALARFFDELAHDDTFALRTADALPSVRATSDFLSDVRDGGSYGASSVGSAKKAPSFRKGQYVLRDLRRSTAYPLVMGTPELLGRSEGCSVRLADDPRVSRWHARLVVFADGVSLEDLGSTNGTFVEGHRLAPHSKQSIAIGQPFMLGDEPFCVGREEEGK